MADFFKIITDPSELYISRITKSTLGEVDFLTNNYEPKDLEIATSLSAKKKRMNHLSYAGSGCGLALAMSLRRYLPGMYGSMSIHSRAFTDCMMLAVGGLTTYYGFAVNEFYSGSFELRRKILLTEDKDYLRVLKEKHKKFPDVYTYQIEMFMGLLSKDELRDLNEKQLFAFDPP